MVEEFTFKRLGHLGERHLVATGSKNTFCGIRSDGPNFSETAPVELEPRADPTVCADCKEIYDEKKAAEEPEAEAE